MLDLNFLSPKCLLFRKSKDDIIVKLFIVFLHTYNKLIFLIPFNRARNCVPTRS